MAIINIIVVLTIFQGALARWENVCTLRPECCHADVDSTKLDEGMQLHEYQLIATAQPQNDHLYECVFRNSQMDTSHGFQLATFETRKEYDCVMQFMLEEHSDPASALPIYIGLESNIADYRRNIFKWSSPINSALVAGAVDPETLGFTAWAPGYPKGAGECVVTYVKDAAQNTLWYDSDCNANYFSICEKYPKA